MSRLARDAKLETRESRRRLKSRHEQYWRQIHQGLSIGYRKGERGGVWYARQQAGKKRRKFMLGIADDHADADGINVLNYKQAFDQAIKLPNAGDDGTDKPNAAYTVKDAMTDYLEWYKAHRKAHKETEHTVNAHILPKFSHKRIAQLTSGEIEKWHAGLIAADDNGKAPRGKTTANRILTVLKAGLNHAWWKGRIESNVAWARVKPFRNANAPKIRYLSEDECKRLINACKPDFRLLVQAALLTGCRYGELTRLKAHDFHHKVISLSDTKAGKPRFVPLTDEGVKFFKRMAAGRLGDEIMFDHETVEWLDGKPVIKRIPWDKSHQTRPMRESCERAKIVPPISFHDLRHTYASLLAMNGVPLQVIARALGHSDTRMTERHYAHLSPDHVAEQIRANLPEFGIKTDNVKTIR